MVILETAAIGAAGYGLYKGGEAGVQKGKDCHREFQQQKKRSSQRASLNQKLRARSERIAEIVNMKKNGGSENSSSVFGGSAATFGSSISGSDDTRTNYAERRKAEKESSSDIDNRHRAVMKKLASGRQEERNKGTKLKKLQAINPFKRK
mmetsp:Transcript_7942/g.23460  ORF Transcript_7942/g.23460 Transcript_7942/m.23460 type:complete len:150 (-) Transcript_7942:816-1265(-)|eukprot:CAMPEP_0172373076 /NCGR_PEP_ID=MMETSP1060-20121228/50259_1 /TAXON_ID=37318 /ORGANISM="Pseudo-nitzschia pungens, Strain cf. cingulata" /LENGTH=149 /DNA_ID=CAMNT_0013099287 /DNA_START=233 /DNA_END=682 /DNA_ORIENTATION=-